MKKILVCLLLLTGTSVWADDANIQTFFADDGYCILGYKGTPVLPWCGYCVHDVDRPVPPKMKIDPAKVVFLPAPPDAVVLFDHKNPSLDAWNETKWKITDDGYLEATSGAIASKENWGAAQYHLEWRYPKDFKGPWGNQGNNGVLLLGSYEIQIFNNEKYLINSDGMAGAVYGQTPPLVNVALPEGAWQTYDIFFRPGVWKEGKCVERPRVTILHNGVMIQNNQIIYGRTGHKTLPGDDTDRVDGPLVLSGHGCPVQFRNVWIRRGE
ncbi:MAG: DUF1080 domain-containing protein [Planctomycetia bacterium]|nr:DUF1080 domain-containing protein [Planctomycetia bacterium]